MLDLWSRLVQPEQAGKLGMSISTGIRVDADLEKTRAAHRDGRVNDCSARPLLYD